jgi:hypothetical protein
LHPRQQNNELFLSQYFGTQCSRFKALVGLVVHPLWPIGERRRSSWLSAKPHPNVIGPPRCPVIAIFTLRGIGEPIAVAAQEVNSSSIELRHLATTSYPIDNARADEIRPHPAESARHPDDWGRLFDILPFLTVLPDPIRQDQCIAVSPELNPSNSLAVTFPFPPALIARPKTARSVELVDVETTALFSGTAAEAYRLPL